MTVIHSNNEILSEHYGDEQYSHNKILWIKHFYNESMNHYERIQPSADKLKPLPYLYYPS